VSNKTKGPKEQTLAKTTYVWGRRTLVLITITLIRYPRWRLISWKLQNTVTLVFGAVVRQNGQKCTITFVFGAVVRQTILPYYSTKDKCYSTFLSILPYYSTKDKCYSTFLSILPYYSTKDKCYSTFVLYFISSHLKSSSYTMSTMQFHSNKLSITAIYNIFEKRTILTPLLEL
jgi:hypothetical protein